MVQMVGIIASILYPPCYSTIPGQPKLLITQEWLTCKFHLCGLILINSLSGLAKFWVLNVAAVCIHSTMKTKLQRPRKIWFLIQHQMLIDLIFWDISLTEFTWLVAMGLPEFFTHSSTIFTTARRIFGSGDFSMREVRMTWMKFFLISIFMTDSLVFTRSRLSMTNSLVTTNNTDECEHTIIWEWYSTEICDIVEHYFPFCWGSQAFYHFPNLTNRKKLHASSRTVKSYINLIGKHWTYIKNC